MHRAAVPATGAGPACWTTRRRRKRRGCRWWAARGASRRAADAGCAVKSTEKFQRATAACSSEHRPCSSEHTGRPPSAAGDAREVLQRGRRPSASATDAAPDEWTESAAADVTPWPSRSRSSAGPSPRPGSLGFHSVPLTPPAKRIYYWSEAATPDEGEALRGLSYGPASMTDVQFYGQVLCGGVAVPAVIIAIHGPCVTGCQPCQPRQKPASPASPARGAPPPRNRRQAPRPPVPAARMALSRTCCTCPSSPAPPPCSATQRGLFMPRPS